MEKCPNLMLLLYVFTADDALVASIAEVYNQDRAQFNKNVRPFYLPSAKYSTIDALCVCVFLSFRLKIGSRR